MKDPGILISYIGKLGSAAVAFSGGVDSSVVAAAAYAALGDKSLAVTVASELVPEADVENARNIAKTIGIEHVVVKVEALSNESVASNPPDRCYHCKSDDFAAIFEAARARGIINVLDGTNHDDSHTHRPGIRALRELGVASPLMEHGITKADVRRFAAHFGLPNADRPSSPCLASRIPYGTRLTVKALGRVAAAEEYLHGLGFAVVRVRDYGDTARIEVVPEMLPKLVESGEIIVAKLRTLGYNYVSADLQGFRSGSMDEHARNNKNKAEE